MHIISREAFHMKEQLKQLSRPQNIAIAGLFTAMYIVLSYFNIRISSVLEIRFAFLMLAGAAMYGGPVMGVTVAFLSDVISTILSGQAFFPGFTISYMLLAFCFGLIFYRSKPTIARCITASLISFIVSITLNTLWLTIMYGTPFTALFLTRLPKSVVMFFVNIALLYVVLGAFERVLRTLHLSLQGNT